MTRCRARRASVWLALAFQVPSLVSAASSDSQFAAELQAAHPQAATAAAPIKNERDYWASARKLPQYEQSVEFSAVMQVLHLKKSAIEQALTQNVDLQARVDQAIFRLAWPKVAAAARMSPRPWAVVFDLDDTLLDGSAAQRALDERFGGGFNAGVMADWINQGTAAALPGAKDFLARLHRLAAISHGRVVFITDRKDAQTATTLANLKRAGLWDDADLLLNKADSSDDKAIRRICVERGRSGPDPRCQSDAPRRIIARFGDSLRDFEELCGRAMAESLRGSPKWGTEYSPLWNHMYGQWERDYRCN